jgi:cation-transporting ATPase E
LDKTGTITDGTMVVKDIKEFEVGKYQVKNIIAMIQGSMENSNPTSLALIEKFGKNEKSRTSGSIPFSSSRKFAAITSTRHKQSFLLGAPEFILKSNYDAIKEEVENYAKQDFRVLLLASSPTPIQDAKTEFEAIEPVALILIEDRIREEAIDTIAFFKQNEVSVRVISGDNPLTVSSIASRVGIDKADKYISLDGMNDQQIIKIAHKYTVFGRVSPAQKQLLIKTFKARGDTVAMTGDGVNDILALKEADCSIAMANGSEAARNISHLVLMDSNFSTLPLVVKEGRRVINNIQKVATLFLTKTVFSFLLCLIVIILGGNTYPIQTIQLTFYDLPIITIPAYYFAAFESNMNRIKGNFLFNVLFNAIPGALLVGLNYLVILLMSNYLGMNSAAISTTTVLTTAIVGFFVLFDVSQPFNRWRQVIFGLSVITFFTMIYFFHNILEISELRHLSTGNFLLILVIAQYSYIVLSLFHRGSMTLKDWIIRFGQWRKHRKLERIRKKSAKARKKAKKLKEKKLKKNKRPSLLPQDKPADPS